MPKEQKTPEPTGGSVTSISRVIAAFCGAWVWIAWALCFFVAPIMGGIMGWILWWDERP